MNINMSASLKGRGSGISQKNTAQTIYSAPKSGTKKAKKGKKQKKFLKAPFQYKWPSLSQDSQDFILKTLVDTFNKEGLKREITKRGGKQLKQTKNESSTTNKWDCFLFGVNAVTRALEKKKVGIVLTNNDVKPAYLTSHLVELSYHNKIPGAGINGFSELASVAGLQSLTCLAVKSLADIQCQSIIDMVNIIIKKLPPASNPLEVEEPSLPKLDLSGDLAESENILLDQDLETQNKYQLPPENLEFSSLYVYEDDKFKNQADFIPLSSTYGQNKTSGTEDLEPLRKQPRYMKTSVGIIKDKKDVKRARLKNKALKT